MVCVLTGFTFVCGGYHLLGPLDAHITGAQLDSARNCSQAPHWLTPWLYIVKLERPYQDAFIIQALLPLEVLVSLVRSEYKWGYDQETLLKSEKYCRICCHSNSYQQRSLDSLAKVVLANGLAFDYLLAEPMRCLCCGQHHRCTWPSISGKVETQLNKTTEQATWFKKVTHSTGSFFDLFAFGWFGSWGPRLWSALQTLGITLLTVILVASSHHAVFSQTL